MFIKKFLKISIPALLLLSCSNSTSEIDEDPLNDGVAEAINDTTDVAPGDTAKTDTEGTSAADSVKADSTVNDTTAADTTAKDSAIVDSVKEELPEIKGMLRIHASSEALLMGTNSKEANANERPQMKVVLSYDYLLSRSETTCGDFVSTMKKFGTKESFASTLKCESDSLPIADVTYYDAVLFANALSRANSMDSVYEYSRATMDEDGHCTNLQGFLFHPERQGFRLPTEAEWIKAANQKWDVSNSWNNANSGYKAHKVCTKKAGSEEFCDMAGNVMEWVNDWLGRFKDTTVTNYAGAPDAGELGERIVKGGAFNMDETSTNTYSRGDVYTVTSSTRADYVGFRLAYGAIPNPVWMDSEGKTAESIITSLATSFDIYTYTKSYNVKLAFRNDVTGNLAFIDYTSGHSTVEEIQDTISVYHPEISPNGELVAFSTVPEGVTGKSNLYVRNLGKDGTGLVKLDVESAAIPRWRVIDGDTVITYVTSAGINKTEATWKGYSTWQVSFSAGTFGKPRKIMDGSFHGGISEDSRLAVTGARLLRARIAGKNSTVQSGKDSLWYNGEQACNASMAQDGSKRTAFLDFGGKTGRDYVGVRYGTHQYLLVADSNGKLTQYAQVPTGYTFDHTEWAVGAVNDNVVGTLTNANGAHKRITLVNLAEGGTIDLAEGEELWHPSLWIKAKKKYTPTSSSAVAKSSSSSAATSSSSEKGGSVESGSSSSSEVRSSSSEAIGETNSSAIEAGSSSCEANEAGNSSSEAEGESSSSIEAESSSSESESDFPEGISYELDPDSAGMYYNTSGVYAYASQWRYKMELLWRYKDKANVAILGSSRTYFGVKSLDFKKSIFAVNLAVTSNPQAGSQYLFNNYVYPHMSNLKVIIVSIDIDLWNKYDLGLFASAYKSYPGFVYDVNHNFWKDGYPSGLAELTYNSPGAVTQQKFRTTFGYTELRSASWREPTFKTDSNWMDTKSSFYYKNFDAVKDMAKKCNERNIILIGVITPQNPRYKETGSFGLYGLRRSETPALIQEIADISKTYPNFILMDENKMGDHDYTDEMAFDTDHISYLGAEQLTHRLDSLIQTLNIDFGN